MGMGDWRWGTCLVEEHLGAVLGHVEGEEYDEAAQELAIACRGELLEAVERGVCEDGEKLGKLCGGDVAEERVEDAEGVVVRHL